MAKFFGKIGFVDTVEDPDNPGVWSEETVEREYRGELYNVRKRLQSSSNSVNDNVIISNEISIVADPYANDNMYAMRYVIFRGTKWKIESVNVEYPRLRLSVGGVYNGK